ncbi:Uncharacterised protein [Bordetella pertussis]|nr:Uncharacterised protein [Bordetella pertussis]CFW39497.1 Uncharacterised protein [Bordetella pertussis]
MPISTPVSLRSSASGLSITPSAISVALTGPSLASSSTQAKARTSTDSQNGTSRPMIIQLRMRGDELAIT